MSEQPTPTVTNDQLVSELWARDVPFLFGEQSSPNQQLESTTLIQLLACSDEARVRMALIPLFLRHPELSAEVKKIDGILNRQAQVFLRFYYTAAGILQQKYRKQLDEIFGSQERLPDIFSKLLGVDISQDNTQSLIALSKRHQIASGQTINWLETYEHSAKRFIKYAEKFR